jgi:lysyl-tRNA synthetase class II
MTDETPLEHERRLKVARWREEGREPYPWNFPGRVPTEVVRTRAATLSSGMEAENETVRVAGRLRALRVHGRTAFADIDDLSGVYADVLGKGGVEAINMAIADFGGTELGRKMGEFMAGRPDVKILREA